MNGKKEAQEEVEAMSFFDEFGPFGTWELLWRRWRMDFAKARERERAIQEQGAATLDVYEQTRDGSALGEAYQEFEVIAKPHLWQEWKEATAMSCRARAYPRRLDLASER